MTERGRRIVLVAHCLLNVNARVPGLAGYAGVHPLIGTLAEKGYGIVQLPCPEVLAEGLDRAPAPVETYDTPAFRDLCDRLAADVEALCDAYRAAGVEVALVVGVEGSPSCGVCVTNVSAADGEGTVRVPGCGVFARALRERLAASGVRFSAIDNRDEDLGVTRVLRELDAR
ncbi:MAG: 2-thiouracil desulfurase family protein [Anaerosomatales bacterium]|nr:2-thiouracil desulfurase family protein [Anaerosomatales bacterium]